MTTAQILDLTPTDGNLYHNAPNQIRRTIGRYTDIFVGPRMGTVRDSGGRCWDWWETEERLPGGFFVVKLVPAE
jgi:hypothetical protein